MKWIALLLSIASPLAYLSVVGHRGSFSLYWGTPVEPLFILTAATSTFYLFQSREWRVPSLFILALTAFNAYSWPFIHNTAAVLFFVTCMKPLWEVRRLRGYIVPYLLSLLGFLHSYFAVEIAMTYTLVAYHTHLYMIQGRLRKERSDTQ